MVHTHIRRQRRFDEQRRENIRTLHRRVEHAVDITLQMHIICIIIRGLFHAVVKAATLPSTVDETRGSLITSSVLILISKFRPNRFHYAVVAASSRDTPLHA